MKTLAELVAIRNKLWSEVQRIPGVVTVGIGSKEGQPALVLFIDEKKTRKDKLPAQYSAMPVIVESTGEVKPHTI